MMNISRTRGADAMEKTLRILFALTPVGQLHQPPLPLACSRGHRKKSQLPSTCSKEETRMDGPTSVVEVDFFSF